MKQPKQEPGRQEEETTAADIAASMKIGNPTCKCAEKIADGTCKSYILAMQLKHSLSLYESKRWKLLFRSRRYRMNVLREIIVDCLS